MSLQRVVLNFMAYYMSRPAMASGLDMARLRAYDRPNPPTKRTWGCRYETGRLAGVPVHHVRPANMTPAKVLVYLHGGVYVAGISDLHWATVSRLCQDTGRLGVLVDYRLAPEHPFPAALDDATAVLAALSESHGAENLVVVSDSAGGGLALAATMKQRDDGRAVPGKLVLFSPWLDLALTHPDIAALEKKDRVLGRSGVVEAGQWYANGLNGQTPYLSPLYGDLAGLPPMLLLVGTREIFLPDCRAFRDKAIAGAAPLTYREYPEMFHAWPLLFRMVPEGEAALQEAIRFIG
jgi:acetyl esterase/lipase